MSCLKKLPHTVGSIMHTQDAILTVKSLNFARDSIFANFRRGSDFHMQNCQFYGESSSKTSSLAKLNALQNSRNFQSAKLSFCKIKVFYSKLFNIQYSLDTNSWITTIGSLNKLINVWTLTKFKKWHICRIFTWCTNELILKWWKLNKFTK